jgi:hypothetical protein
VLVCGQEVRATERSRQTALSCERELGHVDLPPMGATRGLRGSKGLCSLFVIACPVMLRCVQPLAHVGYVLARRSEWSAIFREIGRLE